jgi:hypothetical protein
MKKHLLGLALLLTGFMAISLTSCGGGAGGSDPSSVAESLMKALQDNDADKMLNLFDLREDAEKKKQMLPMMVGMMQTNMGGITSYTLEEAELSEDGLEATVPVKLVAGNGDNKSIDLKMVKVDGKWKVEELD